MTDLRAEHPQIFAKDVERCEERAAKVLSLATKQGADSVETHVSQAVGLGVNVRLGEVETLEFHRSRELVVCVYLNKAGMQHKGVATTTDDSDAAIAAAVDAAVAIAREAEGDSCGGLAEASLLAQADLLPDLDQYHPWALSADDAIAMARRCEAQGRTDAAIINSEGAGVSSGSGLEWYANSNGFSHGTRGSNHSLNCVLIAGNDNGMQRDYWYDSHCRPELLSSPEEIGAHAARRAVARLNGRKPPTGRYPVLFAPEVAKSLLGHFMGAISGRNLYRKNSFLCDGLGRHLFPDWVTIGERPHLKAMPGSCSVDGDGIATREQNFVTSGHLDSHALGLYSSRRLGLTPTGNGSGVHNLFISDSGQDQALLLKQMGTGLLITELMGSAVNPVTGDYSRGAAGFWVEGGEIAWFAEEFTLAGNLLDMFSQLTASGTDIDRRGRVHCGSLLLAPMRVAGDAG